MILGIGGDAWNGMEGKGYARCNSVLRFGYLLLMMGR